MLVSAGFGSSAFSKGLMVSSLLAVLDSFLC